MCCCSVTSRIQEAGKAFSVILQEAERRSSFSDSISKLTGKESEETQNLPAAAGKLGAVRGPSQEESTWQQGRLTRAAGAAR